MLELPSGKCLALGREGREGSEGTHVVGMKKMFQGLAGLRYADTPTAMPLPNCPCPNRSQGLGSPCDCAPHEGQERLHAHSNSSHTF